MANTNEMEIVQNPFNLPTYQRRLRHLQSITVRNLACPESQNIDMLKFQVYFTLHKDDKSPAFYTSEKITGSLNPTWQSFDLQRCDSEAELTAKFVIVRVWTGLSSDFKVRLESHIHLSGLVYFGDKLQVSGLKHSPDTLLFGMYNHIFCHVNPALASAQLKNLVPDVLVPSGSVPAAVYVDQYNCRPSYSTGSLSRIHTVLRAIKQTHAAVQRIHNTIEDRLVSSSEHSRKLSQREELVIRIRQLRQELLRQTQKKQKDEDELERCKVETEARREQIKVDDEILRKLESKTEEERQMHIQSREMLVKENAQVLFRRKQIIHELIHYIYRITNDEKNNFYICNVKLPNAEDYQGHDDTMVSVALGLTCHLAIMVSKFLNLPLRYPMMNRGSKSVILDHIHSKLVEKEREFPLYGKGKEKFQYNYAVFLLNKNISQLRFYCGLGTADLRETLPNIKFLLEQRLGIRSNTSSQRAAHASSPAHTTSYEGSQASRPSMPPSNSTSSFAPHLTASSDYDARDSRMSSLRHEASGHHTPSGLDPFDLSPVDGTPIGAGGSSHAGRGLKVGHLLQETYHKLLQPPSTDGTSASTTSHSPDKDLEISTEQEKERESHGMNGNSKPQSAVQLRKKIPEEEEKEDLFTSTEDNFFKVNKRKSAAQMLTGSSSDNKLISSSSSLSSQEQTLMGDRSDETVPVSAILWPTGPFQSFKLVKPTAAGSDGNAAANDSSSSVISSSPVSPSLSPGLQPALLASNGTHGSTSVSSPHPLDMTNNAGQHSQNGSSSSSQDFSH